MKTWVYRTVLFEKPDDRKLNALGSDGWELVALSAVEGSILAYYIFKRREGHDGEDAYIRRRSSGD